MVAVLMPYELDDAAPPSAALSPRLPTVAGRTIGIVNNSWHCMGLVTDELRAALSTGYASP